MNGCDSAPQRDSQVSSAMQNLEREAQQLMEDVAAVCGRMDSVARPSSPQPVGGETLGNAKVGVEVKVDLACRIDDHAASIQSSRFRLTDMLSRLEI